MTDIPSFDEYAESKEGRFHPMAGTPVDEILSLKASGDHMGAELLSITAGAVLVDLFAAEEEYIKRLRDNGELK